MDTLVYLKTMLRDKNVASFTPTSAVGIKKVCSNINFNKRNVVVEYGPGTGVFTRYLLDHLSDDSVLILIERNQGFVDILKQTFSDPRLYIYYDSAENVIDLLKKSKVTQADYVLSGIPFSFLPPSLREEIIQKSYTCLRPNGKFLAYQTFFQMDRYLKAYLDEYFSVVNTTFCLLNVPPMRLFEGIK